MSFKLQIPNLFTAGNIVSGVIGIQLALAGDLVSAAWMIAIGSIFDVLDGMVARLLNAQSELGKQLDSLADMVTFGVLPGFIVFQLIALGENSEGLLKYLPYVAILIPVLSAFRLAKFNIDTEQSEEFIGLPTPAHAIFWAAMPVGMAGTFNGVVSGAHVGSVYDMLIDTSFGIPAMAIITSILLVARIRLLSLKFKNLAWHGNQSRFILILLSLLIFVLLGFSGIPIIILLYLNLSIIYPQKKNA